MSREELIENIDILTGNIDCPASEIDRNIAEYVDEFYTSKESHESEIKKARVEVAREILEPDGNIAKINKCAEIISANGGE